MPLCTRQLVDCWTIGTLAFNRGVMSQIIPFDPCLSACAYIGARFWHSPQHLSGHPLKCSRSCACEPALSVLYNVRPMSHLPWTARDHDAHPVMPPITSYYLRFTYLWAIHHLLTGISLIYCPYSFTDHISLRSLAHIVFYL